MNRQLFGFLFWLISNVCFAADIGNCEGNWDGNDYLVKFDQPVMFKHADGVVVVVFHLIEPEYPLLRSVVAQGFAIDAKTSAVRRINGQVDTIKNQFGVTYSKETGCAFDLGFIAIRPAVFDWNDYIYFSAKIEEDSGLVYVNYIGDNIDDIHAEQMKSFTKVHAASYKPKRKVWTDKQGRMFEGDFFSQNDAVVNVYGLNGQKFTLDKSQLSAGDRLFLERCQYGKFDMRDLNSRPEQYLPAN